MNKLIFKDSVINSGEKILVTIKLADDCKNGHQDFSVTADILDSHGKFVGSGCCHDVINKVFKNKYKDFCDLHLCDWQGFPVYAVENGFYHIGKESQDTFLSYYPHITAAQYKKLVKAADKVEFAVLLQETGVIETWNKAAAAAITRLEQLTGQAFTVDSTRSQFNAPTEDQAAEFRARRAAGYYTAKAKRARKVAAIKKAKTDKIAELRADFDNKLASAKFELELNLLIVARLGASALDCIINYTHTHTDTVKFNWRKNSYTRYITRAEYDKFVSSLTHKDYKSLRPGISFEFSE